MHIQTVGKQLRELKFKKDKAVSLREKPLFERSRSHIHTHTRGINRGKVIPLFSHAVHLSFSNYTFRITLSNINCYNQLLSSL